MLNIYDKLKAYPWHDNPSYDIDAIFKYSKIYSAISSLSVDEVRYLFSVLMIGAIRGIVVADWTAGQQLKRLILHHRHDS